MFLHVLVISCFGSSLVITSSLPSRTFPCSSGVSSLGEFRCQNGTGCINIDRVCNGVGDCPDGSDELSCYTSSKRSKRHNSCIVPEHPPNGLYEVVNFPGAKPGQSFDSLALTVRCRRGFGLPENRRGQVFCIQGNWFSDADEKIPKCVRYCKLDPHPSIRFECRGRDGFIECGEYMAPGTSVRPVCNSPIYYSTESLPNMHCLYGSWDYVARCKAECGRITPEAWALVIDGRNAKRGELPWQIGIYRTTTTPYPLICGGSLISNNVVVSAAHCFWDDKRGQLPSSEFAVAIGKLYRDWDNERDFDAQKSDIKAIKIPRLFQGEQANFQQDIAILILETPFTYKTHIRPVCLNFDRHFNKLQLKHGKLGKVAGWGLTTAGGQQAQDLQVIDMPFIKEEICIQTLPRSFREYITGDKFCAGYTNGTALCRGDSGGGLSFPDKELGIDRFYLRGIVSASPQSENKLCNDETYTAFTKVTDHEEFIKESIEESFKKACPHYLFQCADGSCVDQGADCNGVKECADGSDEAEELCQIATNATNVPTPAGKCELPPYPKNGTYVVANTLNAQPGEKYDSWLLTVSCDRGFGVVTADGGVEENGGQVRCDGGKWDKKMFQCGRPNKPGKFIVWFRNETVLLVLWQPPYPPGTFTHYKLWIEPPDAIDSVLYVEKDTDPPGPAQAQFRNLVPGRKYDIYVQSILGSQMSAPTIQAYRTVPLRPQNVSISLADVTENSFSVTWMPPLQKSEFDNYQVSLSGPSNQQKLKQKIIDRDDSLNTTFEGLKPGGSYTATVKTMSGKIASWPATADVTLKPLPVDELKWRHGKGSEDGIVVWWTPAEGSIQDEYKLLFYETGTSRDNATVLMTADTRALLNTVSPEKDYTIAVIAVSRGVESVENVINAPKQNLDAEEATSTPAEDVTHRQEDFEPL